MSNAADTVAPRRVSQDKVFFWRAGWETSEHGIETLFFVSLPSLSEPFEHESPLALRRRRIGFFMS